MTGRASDPLRRARAFDRAVSARLAIPPRARAPRLLAFLAAHTGDSALWLLGAGAALIWGPDPWRGLGGRALPGTLVAGAATAVLKRVFRRRRPPGQAASLYSRFDRHAFPSGHAARGACLAVVLAPLLPGWATMLLILWAGVVGVARVALRIHFASDVIGGWATGVLVGLALRWTL